MFENLDDAVPPTPAPLDAVTRRGRRLRLQRRMIAGACALFVLAGGIATAAALEGGGHKKVVVANPTTTTGPDTTVPETTTVPRVTTTTLRKKSPAVPLTSVAPTTTSTTQAPHDPNDLSMVTVDYPGTSGPSVCSGGLVCDHIVELDAGTTLKITYVVTNNGSWTVDLHDCALHTVDAWTDIPTSGQGPASDGIWPQPYPTRGTDAISEPCAEVVQSLPPGQSVTLSENAVGGYRNAAGAVMPAPVGVTLFVPSFLPKCAQPCDSNPPHALALSVFPPRVTWSSIYVVDVKTLDLRAATGASAPVEMTYTNPLAFTVRMPLYGPCWTVKTGTAQVDCSGKVPAVILGPHATVDLVGKVWARQGFTATGAPLAPGKYGVDLGDVAGSRYSVGLPNPTLTVS
jgi:hypothetical protein